MLFPSNIIYGTISVRYRTWSNSEARCEVCMSELRPNCGSTKQPLCPQPQAAFPAQALPPHGLWCWEAGQWLGTSREGALGGSRALYLSGPVFTALMRQWCQEKEYYSIGVAQWVEHGPSKQRVVSLIPSQGTCLGCRPGPQWGMCKRQHPIDVSLPLSFPSPLSKNK